MIDPRRLRPLVRTTFLLVGAAIVVSCRSEPPPIGTEPLEVEDVGAGIEIDPSSDVREKRSGSGLSGVLPDGFPDELPLHLPASIVDFEGARSATFLTGTARPRVESDLLERWRAAGWTVAAEGSGAWVGRGGGREARLRIEDASPGTRYRWTW